MAPAHLVIDGSNIATEGRNLPSLKQLDEAVRAFLEERPHDVVTVVVDATFEHRIDSSERKMYDEALEAGELLTPPAGTIGRGDKFILEIADRAEATIFSNDSFQEFHGEYTWLFDEGRLVGGKPVPHIGWIFTERTPVRGPKSRQATRAAAKKRTRGSSGSSTKRVANATRAPKAAPRTMPDGSRPRIGDTLPTGADDIDETSETVETVETGETSETGDGGRRRRQAPDSDRTERGGGRSGRRRGGRTGSGEASSSTAADAINDPLPFIEFIADNRPGDTVEGEVVEFSSHGAYVKVGEARCYVPLKSMADPAPRSAREVLERGEVRTFVVQSLDAPRRGIDLAIPGFEEVQELADAEVEDVRAEAEAEVAQPARRRGGRRAAAPAEETSEAKAPARGRGRRAAAPVGKAAPADEQAVEPARRRRAAPRAATAPAEEAAAEAPAPSSRRRAPRRAAADAAPTSEEALPALDVAVGEPTTEPTPAKRRAAARRAAATGVEKASAKKAGAKKATAKKATAKKATVKKAAPKTAPVKKATVKKATAKKAAPKTAPAKKATAKKAAPKTAPAKKAAVKTAPAKKATAKKATAAKTATRKRAVPRAVESDGTEA